MSLKILLLLPMIIFSILGCGSSTINEHNNTQDAKVVDEFNQLEKGIYNRNDTFDIVIDSKNNLMWQDDNDTLSVKKPFSDENGDTAENYCKNLTLGNHHDWRLPTKIELESIANANEYPHINKAFKYKDAILGGAYWTSTMDYEGCYTIQNIWVTDFLSMWDNNSRLFGSCTVEKNKHRIRCVRKTKGGN